MSARRKLAALSATGAVLVLVASLFLLPSVPVISQSLQEVFVTNFPDLWRVEGEVKIKGPLPQAVLQSFEGVLVPPVKPTDTTRLVDAGTLVTSGFPAVVLSLHGQVKGQVTRPGTVGAILIPDQQTIQEAFNELGLVHFALETKAEGVSSATPYFASGQPRYTVGFGSYRVFLYNTSDKTVTVSLFAYLTS